MSDNKFVDSNGVKILCKYTLEKSKQYIDDIIINIDDEMIDVILSDIANATEEENNE